MKVGSGTIKGEREERRKGGKEERRKGGKGEQPG